MRIKIDTYVVGLFLLYVVASMLFVASCSFIVGGHITPINSFLSIIVAAIMMRMCGYDLRENIINILFGIILIIISVVVSCICWDASYDGMAYHQPAIYALSNGWNPFYQSHNNIISDEWNMNLWIDHYCKGIETISATMVSTTGNLESGKFLNYIFPIIVFFMVMKALQYEEPLKEKKTISVLIAFGLSFSTITACQIHTYYIDQFGYYTVLITLIMVYLYCKMPEKKSSLLCITSMIVIAGSTKFNAFLWEGYFIAIALCVLLLKKKYDCIKKIAIVSFCAAMLTFVCVNFNPYITNLIDHHNPVYPLGERNEASQVVESSTIPTYLKDKNRVTQIVCSYTSRPHNDLSGSYIPPYKCLKSSLFSSGVWDIRIGGGGFFFVEILILSFLLFVNTKRSRKTLKFCVVIGGLMLSLLILPMGCTFRYVPFIYLLPFVVLFYSFASENRKGVFLLRRLLFFFLFLNISVAFLMSSRMAFHSNVRQRTCINQIKHDNSLLYMTKNWSFNYKVTGNTLPKYDADKIPEFFKVSGISGPSVFISRDVFTNK